MNLEATKIGDVSLKIPNYFKPKGLSNATPEPYSYDKLIELNCKSYNEMEGDLKYYDCKLCHNKGLIAVIKNGQEFIRKCSCLEVRQENQLKEQFGYARLLEKSRFDNFKVNNTMHRLMLDTANKFLDGNSKAFFIGGTVGAGKTHICGAISNELIKKLIPVKFMNWVDDGSSLKRSFFSDRADFFLNDFKKTKILYIDDFFKGKVTDADLNIAYEIINYRYNNELKTIISSEKTLREIDGIDKAISSRIWEMSDGCVVTVVSAQNMRLKN